MREKSRVDMPSNIFNIIWQGFFYFAPILNAKLDFNTMFL